MFLSYLFRWIKILEKIVQINLISPKQKPKDFPKTTVYVFETNNEQWHVSVYNNAKKLYDFTPKIFPELELYLKETVGEHSEEELKSIILNDEKDDFLGSGNDVDIAKSINTYVLHQVNIFLKAHFL